MRSLQLNTVLLDLKSSWLPSDRSLADEGRRSKFPGSRKVRANAAEEVRSQSSAFKREAVSSHNAELILGNAYVSKSIRRVGLQRCSGSSLPPLRKLCCGNIDRDMGMPHGPRTANLRQALQASKRSISDPLLSDGLDTTFSSSSTNSQLREVIPGCVDPSQPPSLFLACIRSLTE